jgi:Cu(I)/Ag(I) efflux system protein CusF
MGTVCPRERSSRGREDHTDEGMTMVLRAADPAMPNAVKAGDKVKFDADKVNDQLTVTKIEKAK